MLTRNPGGAGVDWRTGVVRGEVRSWAIFGNDRSWRAPSARVQACQALQVVQATLTTQGTHRSQQGIYLICLYCTVLYCTALRVSLVAGISYHTGMPMYVVQHVLYSIQPN